MQAQAVDAPIRYKSPWATQTCAGLQPQLKHWSFADAWRTPRAAIQNQKSRQSGHTSTETVNQSSGSRVSWTASLSSRSRYGVVACALTG